MSPAVIMFIGLLVSFLFLELAGIYPGGIIVPGFLALYVTSPARLSSTLAVSLAVIFLYRLVTKYALIFGRRKFIFMVLTGAVLTSGGNLLFTGSLPFILDSRVIGLMIPGLLANNADNQGLLRTYSAAVMAMVLTYIVSQLYMVFAV